jgi:hypothetical protein
MSTILAVREALASKSGLDLRDDALVHENALRLDGIPDPTYAELVRMNAVYGPEFILESATHLSEYEFARLAAIVVETRFPKPKAAVTRRRRGGKRRS